MTDIISMAAMQPRLRRCHWRYGAADCSRQLNFYY